MTFAILYTNQRINSTNKTSQPSETLFLWFTETNIWLNKFSNKYDTLNYSIILLIFSEQISATLLSIQKTKKYLKRSSENP